MTTIVSHYSPDLDSLTSTWIVLKFGGHPDAGLAFVGAGTTLDGQPPDYRPDIIHVDTGLGRFDHHQPEVAAPDICAAKLVMDAFAPADRALAKMVDYVVLVDNGLVDPSEYRHPFAVTSLITGLNRLYPDDSERVARSVFPLLDAWYRSSQEQVAAEEAFTRAAWFDSHWGQGVVLDDDVDGVQSIAYAAGALVYVYRSAEGRHGITAPAASPVDLTPIAEALRRYDPATNWYLHPSKKMLLNGSRKAQPVAPTRLALSAIVDLLRRVEG